MSLEVLSRSPVIRLPVMQPANYPPAICTHTHTSPPQDRCWARFPSHTNICSVVPRESREPRAESRQLRPARGGIPGDVLVLPTSSARGLGFSSLTGTASWLYLEMGPCFCAQSSGGLGLNEPRDPIDLDLGVNLLGYLSFGAF